MKIKRLNDLAKIPTKGSVFSAGFDLYAAVAEPITILSHGSQMIPTGLSIAVPYGWFGGIFARSGLACKQGLRPANCVGVVDADYRGEVMVCLHNDSSTPRTVEPGERIAQLIVVPFLDVNLEEVDELEETARASGGFGSTGQY